MNIRWYKDYLRQEVDLDDLGIYSDEWKNMKFFDLWTLDGKKLEKSLYYVSYSQPIL